MVRILFAIALVFAACALNARAQTNEFPPPQKATQLMGLKVEDSDGRNVGTLRNLILDKQTGQVRYAVIAYGGFLGIRPTLKLAPAQIMSAATTKRETLSLNATMGQLKGAPAFRPSQLNSLTEPGQAEQITRYFEKTSVRIASTSGSALGTTGAGAGSETKTPSDPLKLASDLIGRTVVNHQRQKIGEVVDLLVRFNHTHSAFAIVSTGKFLWRGREYAIPITSLNPVSGGGKLMVDADANALQKAPRFNQQIWDGSNPEQSAAYIYSKAEQ
jgi:sporulation protein YlmC with PRC-barrel domain